MWYTKNNSKNTLSTSSAIKYHSVMKTCRVEETPRTTTPTGYEPKQLETKIIETEAYSGDPYKLYEIQERFVEEYHQASITEEVEEFRKIDNQSCIQSQMHFADSAESIADSDLEDGELRKMLTSPLYAQKATMKPDAMVMQE